MSQGLSANGFGPPAVTWESLRAWCDALGHQIEPWEARALVRLGYARAVIESEKASAEAKKK